MAKRRRRPRTPKQVESFVHEDEKRTYIPSAEHQSVMADEDLTPIRAAYERRNRDLDPQLVWRGKDQLDEQPLYVQAPPLFVQEKVHPKALIDDLRKLSDAKAPVQQLDLFADFNGLPDDAARTEFYEHEANWTNRMILGDSLQVMASLAEREGLRGKVQCVYIDPPYGIKFNSNFQWSTTSRNVDDNNTTHITREPEQVKAFRDTWRDGIHSYLTYLRDRLTLARELLTESGSCFVQIGDENVHRVRAVMDEVFGSANCVAQIAFAKTTGSTSGTIPAIFDTLLWYARDLSKVKTRRLYRVQIPGEPGAKEYKRVELANGNLVPISRFRVGGQFHLPDGSRVLMTDSIVSSGGDDPDIVFPSSNGPIRLSCKPNRHWKPGPDGIRKLWRVDRLLRQSGLRIYKRYLNDFPYTPINNMWTDTRGEDSPTYVVQTDEKPVERCMLMSTDPGDLVLDPTCGSGTTATVAEQWGRRWITIDTSRVALALARARVMSTWFPYYLLADSRAGQAKAAEITRTVPSTTPTYDRLRQGFVYERAPHIMLSTIVHNAEIDVIWEDFQTRLEPLREQLNKALSQAWEEWEIPRDADEAWANKAQKLHAAWWKERIARQKEIDASIAAKADYEYLYDKPYEDRGIVRVAGPFTVESLSPHRMLGVDENDEPIDPLKALEKPGCNYTDYAEMILDNLRTAGVQQAHKDDKIEFVALTGWPGHYVCAEGRYLTGQGNNQVERRAGIYIGPEFGTVTRPDLMAAAREAGDAGFDTLIACAFSYTARCADVTQLGRLPILQARMNADLHMAEDLRKSKTANLFVVFGEPDISVTSGEWLVASGGRMVLNYGQCKELSGANSLAEINRSCRDDLQRFKDVSAGRAVRADQPGSSRGGVGASQHRRGRRQDGDGRVSAVSERGVGVAGGGRDVRDPGRAAQAAGAGSGQGAAGPVRGDQPHARWPQAVAEIEALTPDDLPLSLTTQHYTQVTLHGVDIYRPTTGEVESNNADEIACWFIDSDYDEESFFVRQAYFLGANDPYKSLKTTLKAEINREAWESLRSDVSRPFDKPRSGRIAVKVINHLGDEVLKVFRVE